MINLDVLIAYARLKNDRFGSTTVAVRKTLSREARAPEKRLNLEKNVQKERFQWTRRTIEQESSVSMAK